MAARVYQLGGCVTSVGYLRIRGRVSGIELLFWTSSARPGRVGRNDSHEQHVCVQSRVCRRGLDEWPASQLEVYLGYLSDHVLTGESQIDASGIDVPMSQLVLKRTRRATAEIADWPVVQVRRHMLQYRIVVVVLTSLSVLLEGTLDPSVTHHRQLR